MNLTGLGPELRQRIENLAEATIRGFDGAPESVAAFSEAQELLGILNEVCTECKDSDWA